MEDYNKIIESLGVRFIKTKNIKILKPYILENFYDVENLVILLHKGEIFFGPESTRVEEGDVLFIPGGRNMKLCYGAKNGVILKNEEFLINKEKYIAGNKNPETIGKDESSYSYVSFDAKVFDSVNFFTSLDIDPFIIRGCKDLNEAIVQNVRESLHSRPGKERLIKLYTERVVIEVVRYIIEQRMFVEQLATNTTYFKDPRLINIFTFIKNHLGGDLSNHVLADVANVSEDYVGQYFKMLTGINPQDYIEYQRMEHAVHLLRTTKGSIRDISKEVGYKDTAYFCRRFKMMFGIPAGKMRRRETMISS